MRYHVYYHLVQIARNVDQVKAVYNGVDQLKQQFATCPPVNEQMQKLLRLLHEVLLGANQGYVDITVNFFFFFFFLIIT